MATAATSAAAAAGGAGAAAEANPNPFPEVCRAEPIKFNIEVKLNKEISKSIQLINVCSQSIAFKVKTTNRDRYGVRPTQGYIAPGATRNCEIILAQMKEYPPADIRDKFLVQSVAVQSEAEDIAKFWRDKEKEHVPKTNTFAYHEQKIKCKLHVPAKVRAEIASQKGAVDAASASAASASTPAPTATSGASTASTASAAKASAAGATGAGGATDEFGGESVGRARSGGQSSAPADSTDGGRPNTATGNVSGIGGPPVSARDARDAAPAAAPVPRPSAAVVASAAPGAAVTAQGVVVQAPAGVGVLLPSTSSSSGSRRDSAAIAAAAERAREFEPPTTAPTEKIGGSATGKSAALPSSKPTADETGSTSTVGVGAGASRAGGSGDDSRKPKESKDYRDMLNDHVKLTLDHERLKREHTTLLDAYNKLQKNHETVQKTLQDFKHLSGSNTPEGSSDADSLRRRNAASAASGDAKSKADADAAAATAAAVAVATANANATSGGVPVYVLAAVALLFFVLGRIFS